MNLPSPFTASISQLANRPCQSRGTVQGANIGGEGGHRVIRQWLNPFVSTYPLRDC